MHRVERTVIVILRRTGADAAQNGKEVAPVASTNAFRGTQAAMI